MTLPPDELEGQLISKKELSLWIFEGKAPIKESE
jgi:hypothetical protein